MEAGIVFDDKWHTYRDWGLELISVYIPMPATKTYPIDVPGGDGSIDMTEANGRAAYSDREGLELLFYFIENDRPSWFHKQSEVATYVHGKKVKLILDDEPDHYYIARLSVNGKRLNPLIGEITMTGTAEPFKCDLQSSQEEWLWDAFNFETGVIRQLSDIAITPSDREITILGAGIDTAPIFVVAEAANLSFKYKERTYTLKPGKNRFPAVRVGADDVTLTFSGTGKFSVDYRGRYL